MEEQEREEFVIEQDSLEASFKEHLAKTDNYRILFSGPFGQGKTTFLNKVFEDEQEQYHTIKLFPVNYSVSSNEDVFNLIKFDILTQLIAKYGDDLDLREEDFSKLLTAQVFIKDKVSLTPWVDAVLSSFGAIGKSSSDFFKALRTTVKDFDEFHKKVQFDETRDIQKFVEALIEKEGSAYELDVVSQKIKEFVNRLREKSKHKIVLIIDDLDRLDPEHIFRLFNVFSTQFEHLGESTNGYNKFDFDRIIFVCDIENIRRIYRHKYGVGVDFKGYLDKFYSYQPFDFDNREFVRLQLLHFLERAVVDEDSISARYYNRLVKEDKNAPVFLNALEWLIISLINNRSLNLRTLLQIQDLKLRDIPLSVNSKRIDSSSYPVIIILQVLLAYYPSLDILREKLDEMAVLFDKNKNNRRSLGYIDNSRVYNYIINVAIPFITKPEKMVTNRLDGDGQMLEYSKSLNCYIHFTAEYDYGEGKIYFDFIKATETEDEESVEVELNPYEILSHTLVNLKKLGVLD